MLIFYFTIRINLLQFPFRPNPNFYIVLTILSLTWNNLILQRLDRPSPFPQYLYFGILVHFLFFSIQLLQSIQLSADREKAATHRFARNSSGHFYTHTELIFVLSVCGWLSFPVPFAFYLPNRFTAACSFPTTHFFQILHFSITWEFRLFGCSISLPDSISNRPTMYTKHAETT